MSIFERYERFAQKTFGDAAEQYLLEFDGKCKRRQEYALEPVLEYIADLPLIDIDDLGLQQYKHERMQQVMAGTVNKEIATAAAVLNKAAKVWRWIPSAPKLQRVKGPVRKPYPLTWKEQERLFGYMRPYLRTICIFAVNTGGLPTLSDMATAEGPEAIDALNAAVAQFTKHGQQRMDL